MGFGWGYDGDWIGIGRVLDGIGSDWMEIGRELDGDWMGLHEDWMVFGWGQDGDWMRIGLGGAQRRGTRELKVYH